ncbi:glycerophosphodiester phosphodiesterase [Neolewinella aurantiaca]|uniref:Glycerophosphodiester phosphodiesterase n=1 Tax=Neolewinella aurantiaca TaxID=2602767 RepID=A0A5C7FQ08_9BACT|nr:glycerophosphodiester phosphodiesterase family protein [Neolewinella aurantiaca]TXF88553.1 glycerophosphodiester phosphodiesterase [Neolewinella aurantiaca]
MKPQFLLSLLFLTALCTCGRAPENKTNRAENETIMTKEIDWQGHRGCRGLLPENTIPAFLRALDYPTVKTLELDVVISADDRVIVSHEPWLSPEICQTKDGQRLTEGDDNRISLRSLTAAEIATYDCGKLPHPRFPEQDNRPAVKPTLLQVFEAVDRYCVQHGRPSPRYNIELKYEEDLEPEFVPDRNTFVDLVLTDLDAWGKPELVTLQCFDPPVLAVIRQQRPEIQLAYLDEFPGDLKSKMDSIGFVPPIYSPYEIHTDAGLIAEASALGMRVVPWTVNTTERMNELLELGVDGIITDYPDRIPEGFE